MKQILATQELQHPQLFSSLQAALRPLMAIDRANTTLPTLVQQLLQVPDSAQPPLKTLDNDDSDVEDDGNRPKPLRKNHPEEKHNHQDLQHTEPVLNVHSTAEEIQPTFY